MEKTELAQNEHPVEASEQVKKRNRVLRLTGQLLLLLLLLVLLPILLFQVPYVQNLTAQKLTKFLSSELGTEVSVKKVWLGLMYDVRLEALYVEDLKGDTLVYAGQLHVDHSGVHRLFFRELTIESIRLRNATVRPERVGEVENFQFILDYFSKGKVDEDYREPSPFKLNVRHLLLENVHFIRPDDVKSEKIDVFVPYLEAQFDCFDLIAKRIDLASLDIEKLDFKLDKYEETLLSQAEGPELQLVSEKIPLDTAKLTITIAEFGIADGKFSLRNYRNEPVRTTPLDQLDFDYLDVMDINIHIHDFTATEELDFTGIIEGISLREKTGFVVEKLSAREAHLGCNGLELYGLQLRTPHTLLGDTLIFKYDSYYAWEEDFADEMKMDLRFNKGAYLALRDIMVFVPELHNNRFFKENANELVRIQGQVRGPVNRLDGRNLIIDLAKGVHMEGNFSTLNLAVPDEQFLHLELDKLNTTMGTLRKLIPGFMPPENFNRLGRLDFSGKFDGFFVDFVADGQLRTDIGSASMFMNMKLQEGREKAKYKGELNLIDFDLGAWSGNTDFGRVSAGVEVKKGVGLTVNTASATLEGKIDSLRFKGYQYNNVALNGELEKNRFNGNVLINDENVDLSFDGQVDFRQKVPSYDFKANIEQLSLKPLNISQNDLQFVGLVELSLSGTRLSDIVGTGKVTDFRVVKNQNDTLRVDSALVTSTFDTLSGQKVFRVGSNLGNVDITGIFDIEKIPNKFTEFVSTNYPGFAKRLGLVLKDTIPDTMRFDYRVELFELQNLVSFFEKKISGFDSTNVSGSYNGLESTFSLKIEVPAWSYGNVTFDDVYFNTDLSHDEGLVQVGVVRTVMENGRELSPVSVIGTVYGDTLEFLVVSTNFFKILDNLNINGVLSLEGDDAWRISFKQSDLVLLNRTWAIDTTNYIRIGGGKVETNNFKLTSGDQLISLTSVRNEGLALNVRNVSLQSLEFIQEIQRVKIDGVADLQFKAKDIFQFEGLEALLRIDSLSFNGDNYGVLRLDASAPSIKESVSSFLTVDGDSARIVLDGYLNPPGFVPTAKRQWQKKEPNYFDFELDLVKIPTHILQYFVADISNVEGSLSGEDIHLFGQIDEPELDGFLRAENIKFTVNPLQTTYRVPLDTVRLTSTLIDATGAIVYDRFNNPARLEGGLTHHHLRDFGLDLYVRTMGPKGFLGLETTERNNPVFYGTAIGAGHARFMGSFAQPSLTVRGRTMDGTHMFLPLTGTAAAKETRFIKFTEELLKSGQTDTLQPSELRGLNMEYDLDITEEAVMEVIFDKAWGDVLKGTGTGTMKVIMTRDGRFDMYGEYEVVEGDYLFTMMNIGLNKPFKVAPGGTVTWSGNPYQAIINVDAVYEGLSAPVANFVGEYLSLASENARQQAQTGTPVTLSMNLTGQLLKPDIQFDIAFPSLDSELRGYAENKMRTIRQDPNELNRQVFGLLVLGQFLPSGYTLQAGDVGLNTLSEMLSTQLSIYVTEFVSELLVGSSFIQGIDLDLSYNRYSSTIGSGLNNPGLYTGDEVQLQGKIYVTDRLAVSGGVNIGVGGNSPVANSGQSAGDFQIEYTLTSDKRLKIKAYSSTEPDIGGGRRNKTGAGLSFRKEFDSIHELFSSRKK